VAWNKVLLEGKVTGVDLAISPRSNTFLKTTSTGVLSWASPSLSGDVPFSRLGMIGDTPPSGNINPTAYICDRQNTNDDITGLYNVSTAPDWVESDTSIYRYDAVFCKVTSNHYVLNHGYSDGELFPIYHYNMSEIKFNGLFIAEALDNNFYVLRWQTNDVSSLNEEPTDYDDDGEPIDDSANIKGWNFDSDGVATSQNTVNTNVDYGNYFTDLAFLENLHLLQIEGTANQITSTLSNTILDTLDGSISGPQITLSTVQDIDTSADVNFGSLSINSGSQINLGKYSGTEWQQSYLKQSSANNLTIGTGLDGDGGADTGLVTISNNLKVKNNFLMENANSYTVSLIVDPNMGANVSFTLPSSDGVSGNALITDGSGTLSFSSVLSNPMTGTGDLIAGGTSGTPTRLELGAANSILWTNGTTASWTNSPTIGGNILITGTLSISTTGILKNGFIKLETSDDKTSINNLGKTEYTVPEASTSVDYKFLSHNTSGIPEWTLPSHSNLDNVVAKEHIDWTTDQSSSYTIDSANYTDTTELSTDTTPSLGGELDCGTNSIGFTQQGSTGSGGVTTIDWKNGNKYEFTFGSGNGTLSFTAPTNPCNLLLKLVQDGTGSRTITWNTTIKWSGGGTAPTLSTDANAVDIISFYFDGSNYYGAASLDFA